MKPTKLPAVSEVDDSYNPALPEAHGSEQISDEQSGNMGMQEALLRGTDDADRTRPTDISNKSRN
ncbi:MAG: hypothetical protein MK052_02635 [Alphaproteobacteria bacterium]|nr:hypothetical protein [Alphaproteobacteria bacterium]